MGEVILTLSNTPVEAWQGLIGALAGGLLTFIAVSRTNRSNREQLSMQLEHAEKLQRQRLVKERFEELYSLVSQWADFNLLYNNSLIQFIHRPNDKQQFVENISNPLYRYDHIRLGMITGIYGGAFRELYGRAIAAKDRMKHIENCLMTGLNPAGEDFSESLSKAYIDYGSAIALLKEEIAKSAKEL